VLIVDRTPDQISGIALRRPFARSCARKSGWNADLSFVHRLLPLLCLLLPALVHAEALPGYYRFPAIHGDTIVFTAEGDLWEVGTQGGTARWLTSHPAEEAHAAISPDGTTVAFSASYEGPGKCTPCRSRAGRRSGRRMTGVARMRCSPDLSGPGVGPAV